MRFVCISDTHLRHTEHKLKIPDGDVLIHAGDLTIGGNYQEIVAAGRWLKSLPHAQKVVIAGNHDFLFQKDRHTAQQALDAEGELLYLQDSVTGLVGPQGGILVYGSPWTPHFYDWAFQLTREGEAADSKYPDATKHWKGIPENVQILVTHGPPYGTLDVVTRRQFKWVPGKGEVMDAYPQKTGDEALARRIHELPSLRLHVFGHIHPGYGKVVDGNGTVFVNASTCDNVYLPVNPPIVVDLNF